MYPENVDRELDKWNLLGDNVKPSNSFIGSFFCRDNHEEGYSIVFVSKLPIVLFNGFLIGSGLF